MQAGKSAIRTSRLEKRSESVNYTAYCSSPSQHLQLHAEKSSRRCAAPIPGGWLFGERGSNTILGASVRSWVSDTVPHLLTQGRSCAESALNVFVSR
jgi:hypothetical protein